MAKIPAFAVGRSGFGVYEWDRTTNSISEHKIKALPEAIVAPGFVDIHIHGGYGIDATAAGPKQLRELTKLLLADGYEAWAPTSVTAPLSELKEFAQRVPTDPSILGFHLEGPFISPKHPGAQPVGAIAVPATRDDDWNALLTNPHLKVMTLAPETNGALALIKILAKRGVKVGLGHTDATYAQAEAAVAAGATHTTHTFNAMRPFHHREAGIIGYSLNHPKFYAELIYDRIHVSRESATTLIRAKSKNAIIAVSDGTMASGVAEGTRLKMWGLDVVVGKKQVRLESGALAGSAITLRDAFENLVQDFGPELAIRATSLNPRRLLKMKRPPTIFHEFDLEGRLLR